METVKNTLCKQCDGFQLGSWNFVRVGGDLLRWCDECLEAHSFYCERSEEYFCDENYHQVFVDGESVCLEWHDDELYVWDSDGEYHWEPEDNSFNIPDYHHSRRPWADDAFPPLALGVELECWSSDRRATCNRAESLGLIGERDGSLCDEHGIEIIGSPQPLDWYGNPSNSWKLFCDRSSVRCWDAEGDYGQHVSINVADVSQLAIAKAIVFIHHNRTLCELVAGRGANTYNVYKDVKIKDARGAARDKYCATNWNPDQHRLELRIFRANRRWEGFLKNVEFAHAVVAFAAQESARELNSGAFWNYVESNPLRKANGSYSALRKFLKDDGKENQRYWFGKEGK